MTLGAKVLIKTIILSAILFLTFPPLFGIALSFFDESVLPPDRIIENFYGDFDMQGDWMLMIPPFIILVLTSLIFGGFYQRQVKRRNRIAVNGITIFSLWMLFFISGLLTAGIIKYQKYGIEGFKTAYTAWVIYGLGTFIFLSFINFIAIGLFMGRRIKI